MVKAGRHPFAEQLIGAWQARLDEVRTSLERDPAHLNAWLWRIHERILGFLVARYADDQNIMPDEFRPPRPRALIGSNLDAHRGAPPKSRELIRRLLQQISAANRRE